MTQAPKILNGNANKTHTILKKFHAFHRANTWKNKNAPGATIYRMAKHIDEKYVYCVALKKYKIKKIKRRSKCKR
jgi:hypothetical protein